MSDDQSGSPMADAAALIGEGRLDEAKVICQQPDRGDKYNCDCPVHMHIGGICPVSHALAQVADDGPVSVGRALSHVAAHGVVGGMVPAVS